MEWSNVACATSPGPNPMLPSRIAQTSANRPAAGSLVFDVLNSLHPHLEHKIGRERLAEIVDLGFSER